MAKCDFGPQTLSRSPDQLIAEGLSAEGHLPPLPLPPIVYPESR